MKDKVWQLVLLDIEASINYGHWDSVIFVQEETSRLIELNHDSKNIHIHIWMFDV